MTILIAATDADIAGCYPPMRELRPHIAAVDFVSRVRSQERAGYRLAFVREAPEVVAVAGFRIGENLAWGRFLYVDDLVTLPERRSGGYGALLLAWLRDYATRAGCSELHLDSGLEREAAHRFYEREGMTKAAYHLVASVELKEASPPS